MMGNDRDGPFRSPFLLHVRQGDGLCENNVSPLFPRLCLCPHIVGMDVLLSFLCQVR